MSWKVHDIINRALRSPPVCFCATCQPFSTRKVMPGAADPTPSALEQHRALLRPVHMLAAQSKHIAPP